MRFDPPFPHRPRFSYTFSMASHTWPGSPLEENHKSCSPFLMFLLSLFWTFAPLMGLQSTFATKKGGVTVKIPVCSSFLDPAINASNGFMDEPHSFMLMCLLSINSKALSSKAAQRKKLFKRKRLKWNRNQPVNIRRAIPGRTAQQRHCQ